MYMMKFINLRDTFNQILLNAIISLSKGEKLHALD
jgi:hypothetical protein